MYKFRSVKITHDILHRIDFSYIAELFRFMGIFVCENILISDGIDRSAEEEEAEKNTVYSAEIYIGKREINETEAEALGCSVVDYQDKLNELSERTVLLYDDLYIQRQLQLQDPQEVLPTFSLGYEPVKTQGEIVCAFLDKVLKGIYDKADERAVNSKRLSSLINIYINERLWLHSMNMQYYSLRPSEAIVEAKGAFLAAHATLKDILKSDEEMGEERRLYEYACLWCEVKINNACNYENEILYFSLEDVAKRCRELSVKYPDFTNAKILLGLCYEPSVNSANEALAAFDNALKEIRSECFASAVYYWVGKRYESYSDRKEYAKRGYEYAYQRKAKFRNIFKLAIGARDREDYETSIKWFDEIIKKLELKRKLHFLDPLEMEYLFKTYVQQCNMYYKEDDISEAIRSGEKAVQIKNMVEEKSNSLGNRYFERFYGGDGDRYREILAARFSVKVVNKMLAGCYSKILDEEKAREYRDKVYENSNYKKVGGAWSIQVTN